MANTPTYFQDLFDRADNTDAGNGWTLTGDLQIVDQTLRQPASSATAGTNARAINTSAGAGSSIGPNAAFGIEVACDDDSTARDISILARGGFDEVNTDDYYGLLLQWSSTVATLKIVKSVAGSSTTGATLVVTSEMNTNVNGIYDSIYQNLMMVVRTTPSGVTIDGYLNNEAAPIITYTDQLDPTWKAQNFFGLRFHDDDFHVAGHVIVREFWAESLKDTTDAEIHEPGFWNFGELKSACREFALRDSNSLINADKWGTFVNMALEEYLVSIGQHDATEKTVAFKIAASATEVELPPWVEATNGFVYETAKQETYGVITERAFVENYDDRSSGSPYLFRLSGRGPSGGLLLKPYPIPTAALSCEILAYGSAHRMIEDEDVPAIPQGECPAIVWGAVYYYAAQDNDRSKMIMAERRWEKWKEMGRLRVSQRVGQGTSHMITSGISRMGRSSSGYYPSKFGHRSWGGRWF